MSETKNAFVVALAKAQSEMENANYNRVNPHFRSSYADLGSVRAATNTALTSNGFALMDMLELRDSGLVLKTELVHESGESRFSYWPVMGTTPQQQGSSITYGRRYNRSSLTGIASEEDDDANEAERQAPAAKTKKKTREEGNYDALVSLADDTTTKAELDAMMETHKDAIAELPEDLKDALRDHCRRHLKGLANG